jgi:hypothetical protein
MWATMEKLRMFCSVMRHGIARFAGGGNGVVDVGVSITFKEIYCKMGASDVYFFKFF